MDIDEAQRRYTNLKEQRQNGLVTVQEYRTLVNQLRVQDSNGTWWQPDPGGNGWIFWNGSQWQPGVFPVPAQPSSPSRNTPGSSVNDEESPTEGTNDFPRFRSGIMDKATYRRISRSVPLSRRPQQWWDRFSITLGIIVAVVWFAYASLTPAISLLTRGSMSEEFDLISPVLMVAIPLLLIWKRKEIDNLLMPLQPARKKFSRKLLIGIGIAIPFLTAFIIYHVFSIDQYPLMYINIIIGTMASYALVRDPVLADSYRQSPRIGKTPDYRVPLIILIAISVCVRAVLADHCLQDPLNARDCMRTTGTAELLAGGVSSGFSGAVNGPTMVQTLSGEEGESDGSQEGPGGEGDPDGDAGDSMDICFDEGF